MGIRYQIDVTFGKIPHRRYVCVLSFLGLTLSYVMRFCIAIAITVMVKKIKTKVDPNACPTDHPPVIGPPKDESNKLDWSEFEQGLILSSFFWGYICTQIPGGLIADRMGPRRVMVISVLLTSLFTIISPPATHMGGMWGLITIRILLGLAQGCFYASLHTVVATWVPSEERGLWGTLVFSGAHFGNFVQNLASGYMLHSFDPYWEYVFYIWGMIGVLWSIVCFFTTWDDYTQIPNVMESEKEILNAYFEKVSKKEKVAFTPWKQILTSGPVWAIVVCMIGHDWGLFALVVDIPKYMKSVLRFDVKSNGTFVAIGYLVLCALAYSCGYLVDLIERKKWMNITWNRIIFTTIASVGPSVGLLGTSYSSCTRWLAVLFLVLGMCTMGAFYPSLKVNPIDLSPNHAGVIGAMGHTIGAFSGILVPYLIGVMTPDSTWEQWNWVWWLTFVVMSVTNVYYVFFASGEVQPWNTMGLQSS